MAAPNFTRALGGAVAAVGAMILCSTAAAAAPLGDFCAAQAPVQASDASVDKALLSQAAEIERRMASGEAATGERPPSKLAGQLTDAPPATASARARSAFCAAVGELVRRGRPETPISAVALLQGAFVDARAAGDRPFAALAAFRLSLALDETRDAGTQTSQLRGRAPTDGTAAAFFPPSIGEDACGRLAPSARDVRDAQRVSADALACAAATGAPPLSAEAALRYALKLLDQSRAGPDHAAELRGGARSVALRSLATPGLQDPQLIGRLVEAALDAGQPPAAELSAAIDRIRALAPEDAAVQAYASALQGRVALSTGGKADAAALFRRAILLESQAPVPLRLPDWYMLLASAAPDERDADVAAAYAALQSVRPLIPLLDPYTGESSFDAHMRAVFTAAVDLELAQGAVSPAAIARAQAIVESYRQAEIESLFGNECAPPRAPIQPTQLRKDEVVLYPILLADRVELIDASGNADAVYHREKPNNNFNAASVAALVVQLRRAADPEADPATWRPAARTLFDLLIAPIAAKLGAGTTLVVLPDGPLRSAPFAALLDPEGRYLAEDTRLDIAPALAFSQPGRDRAGPGAKVVAGALAGEVSLGVDTFPALAGAQAEAAAAAQSTGAGRGDGRLLASLTESNLEAAIDNRHVDVLHLATHAEFNGRSDETYIVLQDQLLPLAELRRLIAGAHVRGQDLDLLVLSACQTALGDDQASMGLAGAAVQAGAHSAIATLWQVNDASTAELMRVFYQRYRAGASKAEALQAAQLALLADSRYRAPYYWAAFTLIGGWR